MIASLLVSVLLVGIKLSAAKEVVQVLERRKELKTNLELLQLKLEHEDLATWVANVAHDASQRQKTMDAIEPASGQVYTTAEGEAIAHGEAMFAQYDDSSAPVTPLKHSGALARAETKLDKAGHFLLGRAETQAWAEPRELVAYVLNYDSRIIQADWVTPLPRVTSSCGCLFCSTRV